MKNFYFLALALFGIMACSENSVEETATISSIYALGTAEDPFAGVNYHRERMMNPATGVVPPNIAQREFAFVNTMGGVKDASENNWYFRGPSNVGGRTRAIALDVTNENRILAGGVSGGLWISDNAGQSFAKATTSLMLHSVTCIAQDKRTGFENNWYYGTGELSGNSSDLVGHGIYHSSDNGVTWQLLSSTSNENATATSTIGDFAYVNDVAVHPTTGQLVVAAFTGIYVSDDSGSTWSLQLTGGDTPNGFGYINYGKQTSVYLTNSGIYYASLSSDCIDDGLWRSENGTDWTFINPTGFDNSFRRIEMAAAPSNEDVVYFVIDASTDPFTDEHAFWKYTYVSGDGSGAGGLWEDRTANLPNGQCTGFYDFDFGYYQTQGSYDMCIAVHPEDENMVFIGGTNIYRSVDGFANNNGVWIGGYQCDPVNPSNYIWPNHHPDNHAMLFLPSNPDVMISAHDGGMSRTEDCLSNNILWENLNNGYGTSQFYTVAIESGETTSDFIIGGLQDNGTWLTNSLNPEKVWPPVFYGDGAYCAIDAGRENYYVSWQGGKTFKFSIDDDGVTTGLTRIDPPGANDYLFINPFILDPANENNMYLAAGQFIWKNDSLNQIPLIGDEYNELSLGWEQLMESDVTPNFGTPPRISSLDMSAANNDIIYYGTTVSSMFRLTGLNGGVLEQTSIRGTNMPSQAYLSCIEVNNADATELMATFSNYETESIFYSTNSGDDWEDVSGNLEMNADGSGDGPSVNWAHIFDNGSEKRFYVGTSVGLFSTDILDGANTEWEREGVETIGNVPVFMITSRTFDGNIVVATHGNGIFSNKEFVSGISDLNDHSSDTHLSLPHPNPMNQVTKFTITAAAEQDISVTVSDVNGREIQTLYTQNSFKGSKELKWFRTDEPNGIYFVSLTSGNKTISHKVVLQ